MAKPGGTVARGYGYQHKQLRRKWQAIVDSGQAYCSIPGCGGWITPGTPWHLDHDDTRQFIRGAAHARCNVIDGARKGYRAQQRSYAARRVMRQQW